MNPGLGGADPWFQMKIDGDVLVHGESGRSQEIDVPSLIGDPGVNPVVFTCGELRCHGAEINLRGKFGPGAFPVNHTDQPIDSRRPKSCLEMVD